MAGPFPLATLACTIDENGITAPSYSDILSSLIASYDNIYGTDLVADNSTQDIQMLAIFAKAINDGNAVAIGVYNQFSPATSVGVGLSSVVKINGLAREVPTNSQVDLVLGGAAGTPIVNATVNDAFGNPWNVPGTVTITNAGTITASATCANVGAVSAAPNTITEIANPQYQWYTATNPASATAGAPIETDAALRRRQSQSTSIAATEILASIIGAIETLTGVTQVAAYENDTATTDANGLPAHSISLVVAGGNPQFIANDIGARILGTGTYGTTSETVTDSQGISKTVNFYRPTMMRVIAAVTIVPGLGYVSTTATAIIAAMSAYVDALPIGANVEYFGLAAAAKLDNTPLAATYSVTTIQLAFFGNSLGTSDLAIAFNQEAGLDPADITLTA
jgi:uncharacterized phage protein gp47/JayE